MINSIVGKFKQSESIDYPHCFTSNDHIMDDGSSATVSVTHIHNPSRDGSIAPLFSGSVAVRRQLQSVTLLALGSSGMETLMALFWRLRQSRRVWVHDEFVERLFIDPVRMPLKSICGGLCLEKYEWVCSMSEVIISADIWCTYSRKEDYQPGPIISHRPSVASHLWQYTCEYDLQSIPKCNCCSESPSR